VKLAIEKDDLGVYLHTALRKACDSEATSLLYNIIHLCGNGPKEDGWAAYLDLAWDALQTDPDPVALRRAAEQLEWGYTEYNALRLAFEHLDDDDLRGMAAWLFEEENP
jgi:hypothetical protein